MYKRARDGWYVDHTNTTTCSDDAVLRKVPKSKNNKLTVAPVHAGSEIWNALPAGIRKAPTCLRFQILTQSLPTWAGSGSGAAMIEHPKSDLSNPTIIVPSLPWLPSSHFLTNIRSLVPSQWEHCMGQFSCYPLGGITCSRSKKIRVCKSLALFKLNGTRKDE